MHRLISFLEAENNLSVKRLKQLYYTLSKISHPDSSGKNCREFILLNKEYEDALKILSIEKRIPSHKNENQYVGDPRSLVLKYLYQYSTRFHPPKNEYNENRFSERTFENVLKAAKNYYIETYELFKQYLEKIIKKFSTLSHNPISLEAHKSLLNSIPYLLYYLTYSMPHYKAICLSHLNNVDAVCNRSNTREFSDLLLRFSKWLHAQIEIRVYAPLGPMP